MITTTPSPRQVNIVAGTQSGETFAVLGFGGV